MVKDRKTFIIQQRPTAGRGKLAFQPIFFTHTFALVLNRRKDWR
jgi:hypothetical protein